MSSSRTMGAIAEWCADNSWASTERAGDVMNSGSGFLRVARLRDPKPYHSGSRNPPGHHRISQQKSGNALPPCKRPKAACRPAVSTTLAAAGRLIVLNRIAASSTSRRCVQLDTPLITANASGHGILQSGCPKHRNWAARRGRNMSVIYGRPIRSRWQSAMAISSAAEVLSCALAMRISPFCCCSILL